MSEPAIRVVDRVADMADWDQPTFRDGQFACWNASTGKFQGGISSHDVFFIFQQAVASNVWVINHNLGKSSVFINQCFMVIIYVENKILDIHFYTNFI